MIAKNILSVIMAYPDLCVARKVYTFAQKKDCVLGHGIQNVFLIVPWVMVLFAIHVLRENTESQAAATVAIATIVPMVDILLWVIMKR